jgi:hypothetical protein
MNRLRGLSIDAAGQEQRTLPLTSMQRSFLDPAWIPVLGGGCCNISVAIALDYSVARTTIQRAIDILTLRHPVLTIRFDSANGRVRQRPASDMPITLRCVDLLEDGANGAQLANALADEDARTPFDLSSAPLCRFTAVRFSGGARVVGTFHHAIFDGQSAVVMQKELRHLIAQLSQGQEPELHEIASYSSVVADIVDRERRHDEYWREVRTTIPTAYELPVKHRRPANTVRIATVPLSVDQQRWQQLRHICATLRISPMMAGAAAVVYVMSRFGDVPRVAVSLMMHGRQTEAQMDVLGCFASSVYAVVPFADDPTIEELLRRVRTEVLTAHLKQPCAYEHSPLATDVPGLNWTTLSSEHRDATPSSDAPAMTFPSDSVGATLVFHVAEHPTGLAGHVAYDDCRMRADDAAFIARAFERFLVALPDRWSNRLSEV